MVVLDGREVRWEDKQKAVLSTSWNISFTLGEIGVIYNMVYASPILPLLPLPNGPLKEYLDCYWELFYVTPSTFILMSFIDMYFYAFNMHQKGISPSLPHPRSSGRAHSTI